MYNSYVFTIPSSRVTEWKHGKKQSPALSGGFFEFDAQASDEEVQVEIEGGYACSHSNVQLPQHPRRRKYLIGGTAVVAEPEVQVPVTFVAVTGLGAYIVRDGKPVHTIAKSHAEAASKLYAKWRAGKIADGLGGFPLPQKTQARLRELVCRLARLRQKTLVSMRQCMT
jgi:hypothetical protein